MRGWEFSRGERRGKGGGRGGRKEKKERRRWESGRRKT
jgi:hypothetical protein